MRSYHLCSHWRTCLLQPEPAIPTPDRTSPRTERYAEECFEVVGNWCRQSTRRILRCTLRWAWIRERDSDSRSMADAVFRGVATRMDFAPIWRSGSSTDSDWRRTMKCCAKVEYILLYFSVSLLLRAFASFAMALRAVDQSWRVFAPFGMVIGESWKLKESREILKVDGLLSTNCGERE